ncbi:MAG: hypothetical protein LBM60_02285 [Clostridium sp.]|jgi:hypothetical protein|nr:hypothetical protein [Clostridium sp.]
MLRIKRESKILSILMAAIMVLSMVGMMAMPASAATDPSNIYICNNGFEIHFAVATGVPIGFSATLVTTDRTNATGADAAVFSEFESIYKCYTLTITSSYDPADIRWVELPNEDRTNNPIVYVYSFYSNDDDDLEYVGTGADGLPFVQKYYLSNEELPMQISDENLTALPAPGNPHWDGETGNAVWDRVPESGVGTDDSYFWRLYKKDTPTPPSANESGYIASNNMSSDSTNPQFTMNLTAYLRDNGYYYFTVCSVGDGLNYSQSPRVVSENYFLYTKPAEKLTTPIGLEWKQGNNGTYYAFFSNLDAYIDTDSFSVSCYNKAGNRIGNNVWTKAAIVSRGNVGIPLSSVSTTASGEYRFTVQANSSRPNVYQSSDMSDYSPWLTINAQPDTPVNPDPTPGTDTPGTGTDTPGTPPETGNTTTSDSSSGGGGSSSGGSGSATPSTPIATTQTADDLKELAASAQASGDSVAKSRASGEVTVKASAWEGLAGLDFQHDSVVDGKVAVRVTIGDPANMKSDVKVSGYTAGKEVERVDNLFGKYFDNKISVLHLDQTGSWGQEVRIAAKFDLTGMDTNKLVFYAYDKATNRYQRIPAPKYSIDKNGYMHFSTPYAGDIIVSDGTFTK